MAVTTALDLEDADAATTTVVALFGSYLFFAAAATAMETFAFRNRG